VPEDKPPARWPWWLAFLLLCIAQFWWVLL